MNNEIGRKITSLTLMTIMLAGAMVAVSPSVIPAAHAANANLFVSAENSQFNNYMSGPQVIEVVVIDSSINDTDQAKGEPDVTVNGKILRMVQAVDGNWYGYFADRQMAQTADATTTTDGQGLDFGVFCKNTSNLASNSTSFTNDLLVSDTVGVAIQGQVAGAGTNGLAAITDACDTKTNGSITDHFINVVREAKQPSAGFVAPGQINVEKSVWPFIQLYNLNPTGNVVIKYNKGGGVQTTTLTFDTVSQLVNESVDKAKYTQGAEVHLTVTDPWLNVDPTDEDSWTFGTIVGNDQQGTYYQLFDESGNQAGAAAGDAGIINIKNSLDALMCDKNCVLLVNPNKQNAPVDVLTLQDNAKNDLTPLTSNDVEEFFVTNGVDNLDAGSVPVTLTEQGPNSGIFGTYDESDQSNLLITSDAKRGTSASITYNEKSITILTGFDFASVDIQPTDAEWNSGEEIPVVIVDGDANLNSRADEDLDLYNPAVHLIPALRTGTPLTMATASDVVIDGNTQTFDSATDVQKYSDRAIVTYVDEGNDIDTGDHVQVTLGSDVDFFKAAPINLGDKFHGFAYLNYDLRSLALNKGNLEDLSSITAITVEGCDVVPDGPFGLQGLVEIDRECVLDEHDASIDVDFTLGTMTSKQIPTGAQLPMVVDVFGYGFTNDGTEHNERVANQVIRIEAEETGDNTSTFAGSLEYTMVNQLNILNKETYSNLRTIANDPTFIVIEDLDDEESPRVNYNDLGADGVVGQVADQQAAGAHSGVVSFDNSSYKTADTVKITLEDLDLNVDSDLVDIYTVVNNPDDANFDLVGDAEVANGGTSIPLSTGDQLGKLLDVTFDDVLWQSTTDATCADALAAAGVTDTGLGATGFTLVETAAQSGIFVGDFEIPAEWCRPGETAPESVTGLDIAVDYFDFRDASGEIIEVGDSAGVRANTGSVSLDRTVYPVPFGIPSDFAANTKTTPNGRAVFPIHQTGMDDVAGLQSGEFINNGDLTVHIRVNDPDFNTVLGGEDKIAQNVIDNPDNVGPVKISVLRGSETVILGYAGGPVTRTGTIDTDGEDLADTVQFGPMTEIAPDAGIFEADVDLRYTDGPTSATCPKTTTTWTPLDGDAPVPNNEEDRFDIAATNGDHCILQGDILQVEYTDPADASGDPNTVTDSATFDLRNGVLQSDKSVYIIGSDMILTLIEPDFDLNNDQAETYDLDLIEWDSDAATVTMGNAINAATQAAFDPEPANFRETGDSTGIFQIVVEIPSELLNQKLNRGEEIKLEYNDWGPSGADFVGDEKQDVNLTLFTSNFGATVELDQKVYTWTDKVYITIVAPDHNFDSNLVDDIGNTDLDPIKVSTRSDNLDNYKLVETGTDTGIFTGEVILTGFTHDADGKANTGDANGNDVVTRASTGHGPTDGLLTADDDDGITVSFEFSEDETVVGSALIRWNIGEVQWLEASYPASGTGVVRVIDPDMNLNPEAVDNFNVDVWSDSDAGGIDLTVTETNEATGIFEGTVFFTTTDESSGHRLRVAEGDTVTANYQDNTLPNPYTTADELDISATSLIGTIVPPLERAPAANLRVVDALGNSLTSVSVDQQVQLTADLANGQDRDQAFAYLVQIQDGAGVTVSLAWITGSLSAGQSFSPALSWIPTEAGTYTATAFVWESVDNPTALSPPVSTTVIVK